MSLKNLHTHVEVWYGYENYMNRRPNSERHKHINEARNAWAKWATR